MTAVNAEPSPDWCACVVVSVGRDAHLALRDVPRDAPRFWYAIAVGPEAALAEADRTIAIDAACDLEPLLRRLEHAWAGIEFVYVVVDQRDDDARGVACAILEAAQDANRTRVAVLLGRTWACHREPIRDVCDAVLRLADERAPGKVADALYGILSPFVSLWFPIPLEDHAIAVREASDARVVARRSSSRALEVDIASLLHETIGPPHFIHVLHAEEALSIRGAQRALCSCDVANATFSGGNTDSLSAEEILVAVVTPRGAPMSACAGRQLLSLVADRATALLPGSRAAMYRQRLQEELAWWTAMDERVDALLQLESVIANVERSGGVVGPALRNPGGSLVAYVLGLSAFDPIDWDLSFEEFVNGHERVALEACVSQATLNLALDEDDCSMLAVDPQLSAFDGDGMVVPRWRAALLLLKACIGARSGKTAHAEDPLEARHEISNATSGTRDLLVYDDQITSVLSRLLKANYRRADCVRCALALGGNSADEAEAECLEWLRRKVDRPTALAAIGTIRRSTSTSTSRSEALSSALMQLVPRH